MPLVIFSTLLSLNFGVSGSENALGDFGPLLPQNGV